MNRTRKKTGRACLSLLVIVMLMSVLCPAALADTDGTEPQLTQQPDQLILQLGTRWAGVEFELRTDAGVFPAPIVVDSSGVLTMDLGRQQDLYPQLPQFHGTYPRSAHGARPGCTGAG